MAALRRFGGHGGRAAGWLEAEEGDEEPHHDSDHLVHARQVMELFNDIDEDGSVRDRRAADDDDSRSENSAVVVCAVGPAGCPLSWRALSTVALHLLLLCVHAGHPRSERGEHAVWEAWSRARARRRAGGHERYAGVPLSHQHSMS